MGDDQGDVPREGEPGVGTCAKRSHLDRVPVLTHYSYIVSWVVIEHYLCPDSLQNKEIVKTNIYLLIFEYLQAIKSITLSDAITFFL